MNNNHSTVRRPDGRTLVGQPMGLVVGLPISDMLSLLDAHGPMSESCASTVAELNELDARIYEQLWPQHSHECTYSEGWQIVPVYGNPTLLEIQRTDDPGDDEGVVMRWSSDDRAQEFVRAKAAGGSYLHRQAINLHNLCAARIREARAR